MSTGSAVHLHSRSNRRGLRVALGVVVVAMLCAVSVSPTLAARPAPVPAPTPAPDTALNDRAEAVIAAARAYLGAPYRIGSEGPNLFDCSGLVFRAFADAGDLLLIGGSRLRAAGYLRWFASQELATTDAEQAERGDLVIYGNGEHIGMYLGDGRVLSALVTGVTVHSIGGITMAPTAFLAVDWSGARGHFKPIDGPLVPITDEPEAPAALVPSVSWIPTVEPDVVSADAVNTDPDSEAIERADMRTQNSRSFELADGSFTTELFASPIFYQPADSTEWEPIDLRFLPVEGDDQTAVARTSPVTLTVSAVDPDGGFLSARAIDRVVSLRVPGDSRGGVPAAAAEVGLDGRFADFRDLLASGAGLRVVPRADGFKAFLVLNDDPMANRFSFALDAPGLTLVSEPDGTLSLRDEAGESVGRFARPLMLDSSDIDGDGGGLFTSAVSLAGQTSEDGSALLTLALDRAFLDEAVYPVFVDLTLVDFPAALSAGAHTFASSEHPNANFGTYQRPEGPSYYELWHGHQPDSRNDNEAYLRFGGLAETFAGVTVQSAELRAFPYWQAEAEAALPTDISRVNVDWNAISLTWNTRPTTDADLGDLVTSEGAWSGLDMTSYVQDVVAGATADYGLMLGAPGSGAETWKRLVAESTLGAGALQPRLAVTWTGLRPRAAPTSDSTLSASWSHPLLAPAPTRYQVQVSADHFETITVTSPRSRNRDAAATSWAMPVDALDAGTNYAWRVRVKYGTDAEWSEWSDAMTLARSDKQESLSHRPPTERGAVL
jgi:NlpC/P60 family protein